MDYSHHNCVKLLTVDPPLFVSPLSSVVDILYPAHLLFNSPKTNHQNPKNQKSQKIQNLK